MISRLPLKRLIILFIIFMGGIGEGYANIDWNEVFNTLYPSYYFRVNVNTAGTGEGKVYYSNNQQSTDANGYVSSEYKDSYKNQDFSGRAFITQNTAGSTVYVYAKPNPGNLFSHWSTSTNGATINNPNNNHSSVGLVSSSTSSRNPTTFTITANFVKDEAKVRVDQNNRTWGVASINPIENIEGQNVTITATSLMPLLGVKFLYWEKIVQGGTPEIIQNSTEVMTVTATATVTTYKAYFSEPGEVQGTYCRIKNKATNKYLSMFGDEDATETTETVNGNNSPIVVVSSFKTLANAVSDPSTVFYLSGVDDHHQGLLQTIFKAQTVETTSAIFKGMNPVSTVYTANGYKFVMPSKIGDNDVNLYLRDDQNGVSFRGSDDTNSLWEIEFLDEEHMNVSYFGVAPKEYFCMTQNGITKYYTSLYTSFPYRLMDGVVAYWIESEESIDAEGKKVTLKEIPTNTIVPGKRAVILECLYAGDASKNRLIPMPEEGNMDGEIHLMHGECGLNGHQINPSDFADQGAFYILSVANTNPATSAMGFYKYSSPIPSNKMFVVIPKEHEAEAKSMSFVWGDDVEEGVTTKMNGFQLVLPDKKEYYDLQGRKVNHPSKGVYIVGGKKVVIK